MKKLFLIGIAATAMLTSCNDETIELNQANAIKFDNAFVENSTRSVNAPGFTKDNLTDFSVWAYMGKASGVVLKNEKVSGGADSWTYTNTAYWAPSKSYVFKAIAPASAVEGPWKESGDEADGDINKIAFTNDGKTDLMFDSIAASTDASLSNIQVIKFSFKHILSKVKFSFTNGFKNNNYNLQISNIKITDAYKTANYNIKENGCAWADAAGSLALDFGHVTTSEASSNVVADIAMGQTLESYSELLLIPSASSKKYNITFTAELFAGKESIQSYNLKSTISDVELKAGYRYNFIATINDTNINPDGTLKPIEFGVQAVENWVDGGNKNTSKPTK